MLNTETARASLLGYVSDTKLQLEAELADIRLDSDGKFILRSAGLFACVGSDCGQLVANDPSRPAPPSPAGYLFGIRGQVDVHTGDTTLVLKGALSLESTPTGPEAAISFSMAGFWSSAFGLDFLHIGNIVLDANIGPVSPYLSGLLLGGEVVVYHSTLPADLSACADCLKLSCYVNIDRDTPLNNWAYASLQGSATINKVLAALGSDKRLPAWLGDTGLVPIEGDKAIVLSYAASDQTIDVLDPPVTVSAGVYFRGAVQVAAGWRLNLDVLIDLPARVYINITTSPINFYDKFIITRSVTDTTHGPEFYANIVSQPAPGSTEIRIRGAATLLGDTTAIDVLITNSGFAVSVERTFLFNLKAVFTIEGAEGGPFSVGAFIGSESGIAKEILNFIRDLFQGLSEGLRVAQAKIQEAKNLVDKAKQPLLKVQYRLGNFTDFVENAKPECDLGFLSSLCEDVADIGIDVLLEILALVREVVAVVQKVWDGFLDKVVKPLLEGLGDILGYLSQALDAAAGALADLALPVDIKSLSFRTAFDGFDISSAVLNVDITLLLGGDERVLSGEVDFDDMAGTLGKVAKEVVVAGYDKLTADGGLLDSLAGALPDLAKELFGPECITQDHCDQDHYCQNRPLKPNAFKCLPKLDHYAECPRKNRSCKSGRCEKVGPLRFYCAPPAGFNRSMPCNEVASRNNE